MRTEPSHELSTLEELLRAQWLRLRDWIDERELAHSDAPSVLPGWTVAELVAHLGMAMGPVTRAQPAPPDSVPLTFAGYVTTYPASADDIAERTRRLADDTRDGPLPAVERAAEEALGQLAVLRDLGPDPVVTSKRGPVRLTTLVTTRLVELVVHGDDLVRSVGGAAPGTLGPIEPGALAVVADALRDALHETGGPALEVADPLAWTRLACGRVTATPAAIAEALRTAHLADGLPEVADRLPLL
jgi:uncharacterized protein (TIGR03083 family)